MTNSETPPTVDVTTTGLLWWKKRHIRIDAVLEDDEHGAWSGAAVHYALNTLFRRFKNVGSVDVTFTGGHKPTFLAYQRFHEELNEGPELNEFLTQQVPLYDITFQTSDEEVIRGFSYFFEDGVRQRMEMKPMARDAVANAKERAQNALREMVDED